MTATLRRTLWFLSVAAAFAAGIGVEKGLALQRQNRWVSAAGQTLQDLSRALESHRLEHGAYPESLTALRVGSESPDFVPGLVEQVLYLPSEAGYAAILGAPAFSHVGPGEPVRHRVSRLGRASPAPPPR